MTIILKNSIRTPDGTVLESKSRHDYQSHTDANGEYYFIDGGKIYFRGSANLIPYEDLSVVANKDTPHGIVRDLFEWGTRGVDGTQPLKYILLKDMDTSHIEAILETQWHISDEVKQVFINEMEWRDEK